LRHCEFIVVLHLLTVLWAAAPGLADKLRGEEPEHDHRDLTNFRKRRRNSLTHWGRGQRKEWAGPSLSALGDPLPRLKARHSGLKSAPGNKVAPSLPLLLIFFIIKSVLHAHPMAPPSLLAERKVPSCMMISRSKLCIYS
jgi:hypothetical protein